MANNLRNTWAIIETTISEEQTGTQLYTTLRYMPCTLNVRGEMRPSKTGRSDSKQTLRLSSAGQIGDAWNALFDFVLRARHNTPVGITWTVTLPVLRDGWWAGSVETLVRVIASELDYPVVWVDERGMYAVENRRDVSMAYAD